MRMERADHTRESEEMVGVSESSITTKFSVLRKLHAPSDDYGSQVLALENLETHVSRSCHSVPMLR